MSTIRSAVLLTCLAASSSAWADRVEVTTPLGSFFIDLLEDEAPATVANFLNYVNDGDYDGAYFHRSVQGFVIQGGGFTFIDGEFGDVPTDAPVVNEFGRSNVRGTVAMAKLGGDPDSATSQWFINLVDNADILDPQNGGFTVFGVVEGDGMQVVDSIIAQSQVVNAGGALGSLPVLNFNGGNSLVEENFVFTDVKVAPEKEFAITPAIASAWYDPATSGQGWFIDVIENSDGSLQLFVSWFTYDNEAPDADEDLDFGSDQQRWFTAVGPVTGSSVTMDLFRNTGGKFNDLPVTSSERIGSLDIDFASCDAAKLTYNFEVGEGGTGEIDIFNLTPDSACE